MIHRESQGVELYSIACPNVSLCYAVGDQWRSGSFTGVILITTDAGRTWAKSHRNLPLYSVACASANGCSAVGGLTANCGGEDTCAFQGLGVILSTTNGGSTWQRGEVQDTLLADVACPTTQVCYASGVYQPVDGGPGQGVYLVTRNGGHTWKRLARAPRMAGTLACPSTTTCYSIPWCCAVPESAIWSTIFGTTDGGATWTSSHLARTVRPSGIACPSTRICYAVGDHGIILANKVLPATSTHRRL